jgi:hypothetical protein
VQSIVAINRSIGVISKKYLSEIVYDLLLTWEHHKTHCINFNEMMEINCCAESVMNLVRTWWEDRIGKSVDGWKEGKLVRGVMVRTITGKGLRVFFETRETQRLGDYIQFLLNRQRSVYGQLGEYVLQGVTVRMVKEKIKDDVGPVEDLILYRGNRGCILEDTEYIIDMASRGPSENGEFLVAKAIPSGPAITRRQREMWCNDVVSYED